MRWRWRRIEAMRRGRIHHGDHGGHGEAKRTRQAHLKILRALPVLRGGSILLLLAYLMVGRAPAQALPQPTQAMLSSLGLPPAILDGVEAELALPQSLVDAASREGKFRVSGTWDPEQFDTVMRIFRG